MTIDNAFGDTLRHEPFRVQVHPLYPTGEQRCLTLPGAASHPHRDRRVGTNGKQPVGRHIHQYIFLMLFRRILQTPSASFDVTDRCHPLRLRQSSFLQTLAQRRIERIPRLYLLEETSHAVVLYLPHGFPEEAHVRVFHLDVEQLVVCHMQRVAILHVTVVHHIFSIQIAEMLSATIAQERLRKVILQSSIYLINICHAVAHLQVMCPFHVDGELFASEHLRRDTPLLHLFQVRHQRISPPVYSQSVYP